MIQQIFSESEIVIKLIVTMRYDDWLQYIKMLDDFV